MSRATMQWLGTMIVAFGVAVGPADASAQEIALGEVKHAPMVATGSKSGSNTPSCIEIAAPPRRLETRSKYDQEILSKSVIDPSADGARRQQLAPLVASISQLKGLASEGDSACIAANLRRWAQAASLTDMATSDANLTRDRYVADIAAVITALRSDKSSPFADPQTGAWLREIGAQIMHYYDWQSGPTSRRNNHRYWAGLAVGSIGYLLEDRQMIRWSQVSFEIGACQIDETGLLPLELARGEKALEYHLYAYRALASLKRLWDQHGQAIEGNCSGRLAVLRERLGENGHIETLVAQRTGYRQTVPSAVEFRRALDMVAVEAGGNAAEARVEQF